MSALCKAAMAYAQRLKWPVFPIAERGKIPAIPGGRGCLDATTDPRTIQEWWEKWPTANVGVAAGERAGFWVLDIDGDEGEESLLDLCREHGQLPDTVEQHTGGGGRHLLFRYNGQDIRNRAGIRPGIDTRGNGGYIVCPPSIHQNGRSYVWSIDGRPVETKMAAAPKWLLALVGGEQKTSQEIISHEWVRGIVGDVPHGRRNDSAARLIGHLLRHYVDPLLARSLVAAWNQYHCIPPMTDEEVEQVFESVGRREFLRRERCK